jgi:hypothetical protein
MGLKGRVRPFLDSNDSAMFEFNDSPRSDTTLCQTLVQSFHVASVCLSDEGFVARREDTDMCRRGFDGRMFMTVVFRQKAEAVAEADRCAQLDPKL